MLFMLNIKFSEIIGERLT